MARMKIKFEGGGMGAPSFIEVDGVDISNLVSGADITLRVGELGRAVLECYLDSIEIESDVDVKVNGTPVSDETGREIYETLRKHYYPDDPL